ncbi:MAG: SAM-dependent methyltransferase [Gammaproteobacteria bacterium]|nr:SAM-dependent methyltransferase [Gammaproteobacteria bacterium]|tara:strand:+ start:730 stop:1413 length:684 start_codon:yes stop_codon:yes gene_type:complete
MNASAGADARRSSPSALRNREPIAQVLQRYLPADSRVLEIAAGTGEHAVYLSAQLAASNWWPSDLNADAMDSINAWREAADTTVLHPPLQLDVSHPIAQIQQRLGNAEGSPVRFDAIVCINMVHISPWQATEGLMRAAGALLDDSGLLYLYGPYQRNGRHTAESNARFDEDLRARDPQWGVRHLEDVCELAARHNLRLLDVVAMPANNLSVILQKAGSAEQRNSHHD